MRHALFLLIASVGRQGTVEEIGVIRLEAGKPVGVYVEYTNTKPPAGPEADRSQPALMRGVVSVAFLPPANTRLNILTRRE